MRLVVVLLLLHCTATITRSRWCSALRPDFYNATCPAAEATVQQVMERQFYNDPTIAPALIRMLFHDCFVTGCDASVMITPTATHSSERLAVPNHTLRGFNIVDVVKSGLEAACPGVVSCADALAIMARESVALLGGERYEVALGRRDGRAADPSEVSLPAPFSTVDNVLLSFASKGFSAEEMVVLLGSHTVGGTHCSSFRYRLGKPDECMDATLRSDMVATCGLQDQPLETDPTTFLDVDTPFAVDNAYYRQLMSNKSLLQVDQEAATHPATAGFVAYYAADAASFVRRFSEAMAKLGTVGVLEGDAGEVRRVCSKYNH